MTDALIASITAALQARPDDLPLRLHLADLLLAAGQKAEAIGHAAQALQQQPDNADAQALMARALGGPAPQTQTPQAQPQTPQAQPQTPQERPQSPQPPRPQSSDKGLDWHAYEAELSDVVPPRFMPAGDQPEPVEGDHDSTVEIETSTIRLADVGGMAEVKQRLELAFLAPMRNPELRQMFGKSLRGGLLLYGPPGCGKTFIARAIAGEMGAKFISMSIVDVLNMWVGNSERNLHEIFQAARRNAPCVLFLDEIDAIGHKRSNMTSTSMRTLANQLLAEMDGMESHNEGVFLLAATNAPWDVDQALRRPGRLDRMVLVAPPDAAARAAIIEYHVRQRPIAKIDLRKLVNATEDYSGADLAHLCESASEFAMHDSITSGTVRMIEQRDFDRALRDVRPTVGSWFSTARNVALFANEGGVYDELAAYLKKRKML
jgi:AAA+ superfamily predicted ATPase